MAIDDLGRRRWYALGYAGLTVLVSTACSTGAGTPESTSPPSARSSAQATGTMSPAMSPRASEPAVVAPAASPGPPFIAEAGWAVRAGVRTLTVVPTPAGRATKDIDAAWQEVVRRHPGADSPSVHDQFICHALFASSKKAWHLEPDRPPVGLAATVSARCNPGTIVDPDVSG